MREQTVVTEAVAIVDGALDDLAAAGATPLDSAAALIAAGLAELRDSEEPVVEQLDLCRMLLQQLLEALEGLQARVPGARMH